MFERKRACVYTRVSTEEQASEGYSIEEQERMCKAAIESKGWEYAGTFSDPGVSGRTMDRAGLRAMLDCINAGEVNAVVIYKLDRLSRKQRHTIELIEDVFVAKDVDLVSLNETLDTSSPWGRAMIGVLCAFNQMESETIEMRTSMGRKAKANQGGYAGGKPPIGYKAVNGELVVVPEEAKIVRLIYEMRYKRGMAMIPIAEELNRLGYRTKKGMEFKHSAIQNVLGNEDTYRGIYRYGKSGTGEVTHEPILKDGEFEH